MTKLLNWQFNSIESKTFLSVAGMIMLFSVTLFGLIEYAQDKVTEIERNVFEEQAKQVVDNIYLVSLTEDKLRIHQEVQAEVARSRQISAINLVLDGQQYAARDDVADDFKFVTNQQGLAFELTGKNYLKAPLEYVQLITLGVALFSLLSLWVFQKALRRFIRNPVTELAQTLDFYASDAFKSNPEIQKLSKSGTELDVLIEKADQIYQSKLRAIEHEVSLRKTVEKAVDTKNIFIASMVHDFRTPLVIMQGALQSLESRVPNHLISPLMSQLEEMELMVSNALDLTRIESGQKVALRPRQFVLFDLLNSVIENFQAEANAKGLYIYLRLESEPNRPVYLDDSKYKQVLRNLLSNAVKYTEQGFIEVKVICEKDVIKTQVTDTGRGISEDQADSIFVPFHRLSNDTIQGTGVGLSFCKLMLQTIGYDLSFNRMEKGVQFEFRFPVQCVPKDAEVKAQIPSLPANARTKHAVIISANSLLKTYLTLWFESYGFKVSHEAKDLKSRSLFILHELFNVKEAHTAFNSAFPMSPAELTQSLKSAREQGARIIFMNNAIKPSPSVVKMFGQGLVLNLDELKMLLHGYQDVEPMPTLEIPNTQTPEFGRFITDKRILIADDIPAYRDLVVKKLKNRGFKHVYVANNGLEAVSLSREYEIDVVFMDHMMPVMSGEEACKAIKVQRPETLVIGFSAVITPALEADLSQSLMDKVYMKDFKQFEQVFEFMQSYFSQEKNHD
ncbi:hybrid sensor histidine kinase/response regulator [Thiosulfativibrio zosterae]|uniref:histidine kinase n=1 Tax=Thiosulfativibrio zosterae TaxID=2675053 RepID=A0A6F8PQP6_9GAMM|nr:hybrid sensor histidine kinase/response regulator [Thiosulfativibrio zosterae]BBP44406.1 hypothetical protein THMIRHAT_21520 [Thiosulfativibrio zosterae]